MDGRRRSVLYVEDDVELREAVTLALEEEGFAVKACGTAEEALDRLAGGAYDTLLTDFRLPQANGDWLLRQAADRGYLDRTSAIVLTADANPPGLRGYPVLRKPVDLDTLICAIAAA
jgi:CheY-like chemotaxis protein